MKTLRGQRWFKPMEVAKLGLIQNSKGERGTVAGHYDFILELIAREQLKARNYSKGERPYWLISETEIQRYHKKVDK